MTSFRFCGRDGTAVAPNEWLVVWSKRYPTAKYDAEHDRIIAKRGPLGAAEFVQIGRWKDAAGTDARWKSGVASVAYDIWNMAALELPQCPGADNVEGFLRGWSGRQYADRSSPSGTKRFGLSRSTTLLYFISGTRYPIFDTRVRRAIGRMTGSNAPNTVQWYVESYCPRFSELAERCTTKDLRLLDKALFSYGAKTLPFAM